MLSHRDRRRDVALAQMDRCGCPPDIRGHAHARRSKGGRPDHDHCGYRVRTLRGSHSPGDRARAVETWLKP